MKPSPLYLDHAATSFPKAPGVSAAVAEFLERHAGNPGRGGHRLGVAATRVIEQARDDVAALLGASPERTLFVPGATFALNLLIEGQVREGRRAIVTSALEHNAVMRPLRALERAGRARVVVVEGAAGSGVPSPAELAEAAAREDAALVVITHASNVTGALLPIAEVARALAPRPLVVDAAQSAGSVPFRFDELGAAALVASGHKGLLGPPGTGVLLLAEGFEPPPLVRGGTGSNSESEEMPAHLPDRLEAGTPNGAGIAGLGAAARYLAELGVENVHREAAGRARELARRLGELEGVRLVGDPGEAPRVATLSFVIEGADTGELVDALDREEGIMMRAGLHCAPAAHRRLGTYPEGTLRASFGPFTRDEDVERAAEAIARAGARLRIER